jgi:hypothetical protein
VLNAFRLFIWMFVGLLSVTLIYSSAQAWVFYRDDRIASDYRVVGVLEAHLPEGTSRGTAFLVDKCGILTNFHVVFGPWTVTALRPPSLEFTARFTLQHGAQDGIAISTRATPVVWGSYLGPGRQMLNADQDWVYLMLDDCLGERFGFLNLAVGAQDVLTDYDVQYASIGYSSGRQMEDPDCRMSSNDETARRKGLGHDCVMLAGDSGSPILKKGTRKVVAIGSGYLGGSRQKCIIGTSGTMTSFISSCSNMAVGVSDEMIRKIVDASDAVSLQRLLAINGYQSGRPGDIQGAALQEAVAQVSLDLSLPAGLPHCTVEKLVRLKSPIS